MAAHNFDYSYEYVGVKTMPLNVDDDTQIVRNITVKVTAVDQDDSSQSLSEKQYVALDGVYSYKHDGLPDTFIPIEDLTDAKVIEWFTEKVQVSDLDNYFTWQIYGIEETPSE